MLEPLVSGAHRAMVKAQEIRALPTFSEIHNPSLRLFGRKSQAGSTGPLTALRQRR
jgi:hypothetical protein